MASRRRVDPSPLGPSAPSHALVASSLRPEAAATEVSSDRSAGAATTSALEAADPGRAPSVGHSNSGAGGTFELG